MKEQHLQQRPPCRRCTGASAGRSPSSKELLCHISGIALSNIDHSVRPQDDLYQHVNGAWLKGTTIPDDRPLEGTFTALRDGSELAVKEIIEEAAAKGCRGQRHRAEDRRPLQQLHG